MSLSFGREYLAIPGPSVIPDRVLQAMHQPSPNIYEGHLRDVIQTTKDDLKKIAGSTGKVALYAANGHGVWEAALANIATRGETVLILATGQFAFHWAALAKTLGLKTLVLDFGNRNTIDLDQLRTVLDRDTNKIVAILVQHVDTATSIRNDIEKLRAAIDDVNHPALLCVDVIASLGCDLFKMDKWGVDVAVAACQKGLMTPAGLGAFSLTERLRQHTINLIRSVHIGTGKFELLQIKSMQASLEHRQLSFCLGCAQRLI